MLEKLTDMNTALRDSLKRAYANMVAQRGASQPQTWKLGDQERFLQMINAEEAKTLIEVGAGTGQDAAFFAANGLDVLAIDLTEENVAACRQKGLRAEVMDVCDLRLPASSFDAAYSLNCLLHLPKSEFPIALDNIHRLLKPGGLFYLGIYGGVEREGVYEEDTYEPKRFFSFWTDEALKPKLIPRFEILQFENIDIGNQDGLGFQSLILRKPRQGQS